MIFIVLYKIYFSNSKSNNGVTQGIGNSYNGGDSRAVFSGFNPVNLFGFNACIKAYSLSGHFLRLMSFSQRRSEQVLNLTSIFLRSDRRVKPLWNAAAQKVVEGLCRRWFFPPATKDSQY